MTKEKIIERLEGLHRNIKDYAKYLEEYTYAPYSEVEKFGSDVRKLIEEIEEDL